MLSSDKPVMSSAINFDVLKKMVVNFKKHFVIYVQCVPPQNNKTTN